MAAPPSEVVIRSSGGSSEANMVAWRETPEFSMLPVHMREAWVGDRCLAMPDEAAHETWQPPTRARPRSIVRAEMFAAMRATRDPAEDAQFAALRAQDEAERTARRAERNRLKAAKTGDESPTGAEPRAGGEAKAKNKDKSQGERFLAMPDEAAHETWQPPTRARPRSIVRAEMFAAMRAARDPAEDARFEALRAQDEAEDEAERTARRAERNRLKAAKAASAGGKSPTGAEPRADGEPKAEGKDKGK